MHYESDLTKENIKQSIHFVELVVEDKVEEENKISKNVEVYKKNYEVDLKTEVSVFLIFLERINVLHDLVDHYFEG